MELTRDQLISRQVNGDGICAPCENKLVSVHLILIYIGALPNYFEVFLKSCEANPTIQWTLITSLPIPHPLPPNVSRVEFDAGDFKRRAADLIGVEAKIERPYKLCDFKPAYGLLYPEIVKDAEFWGHCDADVVFGDLRKFYCQSAFEDQAKVQMRGSLSFYRNNEIGNRLFQLPHPQIDHKDVLSSPKNCCFDEWEGLYKLLKHNGVEFWLSNDLAEIAVPYCDLRLAHRKNYRKQVFTWEDGRILRTAWDEGETVVDEYAYIHLQKRKFQRVDAPGSGGVAFLPGEIRRLGAGDSKFELASLNRRNRIWEIRFQLGRVPRYFRSLSTTDRYYWRVAK